MADNHTKEVRSRNMSHIRSKNTKPEEKVRKYLFSKGFRYRINVRTLPGFVWPSSNEDYWIPKIQRNVERDEMNTRHLMSLGWNVLVVWECQLKKKAFEHTMSQLESDIRKGTEKHE